MPGCSSCPVILASARKRPRAAEVPDRSGRSSLRATSRPRSVSRARRQVTRLQGEYPEEEVAVLVVHAHLHSMAIPLTVDGPGAGNGGEPPCPRTGNPQRTTKVATM